MKYEEVKELIEIFENTDLNDMEVCLDNDIVRLNRGKAVPMPPLAREVPAGPAPFAAGVAMPPRPDDAPDAPAERPPKDDGNKEEERFIKAPIVGTFYQSSSPEKPPYVSVGDTVKKGDVVCIIEAMKFMNEVTSEESGKVLEVLVEDGAFVEFGAPLFRIG